MVAATVLAGASTLRAGCGACGAHDEKAEAKPVAINTVELDKLITEQKPVVVLDARTGQWDDGKRIPGAKTLGADATAEQASAVIPSKDALVVTYCSSTKCGASKALGATLRKHGYTNVREYYEGIKGWTEAGKTVQQVQVAAK